MSKVAKNRKTYYASKFRRLLHTKLNSSKSPDLGGEFLLNRDNSDLMVHLLYISFINDLMTKSRKNSTGPGDEGEITEQRIEGVTQEVLEKYKV